MAPRWTIPELTALHEGVEEHGHEWALISADGRFAENNRDAEKLRDKWWQSLKPVRRNIKAALREAPNGLDIQGIRDIVGGRHTTEELTVYLDSLVRRGKLVEYQNIYKISMAEELTQQLGHWELFDAPQQLHAIDEGMHAIWGDVGTSMPIIERAQNERAATEAANLAFHEQHFPEDSYSD